MSLWALSGTRTPEQEHVLETKRLDYRDPLKILMTLESRAVDDLMDIDPLTNEEPRLNKSQITYVRMFVERHI